MKNPTDFTAVEYARCRCCRDADLINDDGRCSSCWDMRIFSAEDVEDDSDGDMMAS